jgi:hypothetical protein
MDLHQDFNSTSVSRGDKWYVLPTGLTLLEIEIAALKGCQFFWTALAVNSIRPKTGLRSADWPSNAIAGCSCQIPLRRNESSSSSCGSDRRLQVRRAQLLLGGSTEAKNCHCIASSCAYPHQRRKPSNDHLRSSLCYISRWS